jgi:hypothetical protein
VFQRLYPLRVESTGGKTEVCKLDVPCSINEEVLRGCQSTSPALKRASHFGLKIAMNISKFVKLVDGSKHLADVKPRMFLFQDPGVVEQCPEVATGHVLHGEIDV